MMFLAWILFLAAADSQRQVMEYLERVAREITARAAEEASRKESWEKVRERRREELRDMLGLLPWPERTPLNVRRTGVLDKGAYTVEKLAFESMPKVYVTANLYLPKQRQGKVPAIVYVCGHSYSPYGDKAKYQRHGISLAKNGYGAIILDSIQIAETFALHHGVYSGERYYWYSRGYSPAGVEVWNAMRAIDYLETRPEIDAQRIGMTGRSGGAAMSWFTAAVDLRVKAAMPVMGISTYAANLKNNTQALHCDCMFPVNSMLHDMIHQAALIAPRPLKMGHGRQDALFPVPGYEEVERTMASLFGSYQRGDDFSNLVVETGHADSDFLREQSIRFFDRHLRGVRERKLDMDYSNAPEEELAVFPQGPPADALNYRIHDLFNRRMQLAPAEVVPALRAKTFRAFPKETAPLEDKRTARTGREQFDSIEFTPEAGIRVRALIRGPAAPKAKLPALLWIASDGDTQASLSGLLRTYRGANEFVRMAVYPRGTGETGWDRGFYRDVMRNAMHTGRTVDSMRLWDVLRAVELLRRQGGVDPERVIVGGRGVEAGLAIYTGLLDQRVQEVILMSPPGSHVDGPHLLNVLRITDLPDAAALLAPRRVNFLWRIPRAYEKVKGAYLTMDLDAILQGKHHHNFASGM